MQKITPHLWYDKEAKEAAEFYVSLFPNSKITNVTTLHNTPSGDADIVSFKLDGQEFVAISAGPYFKFNPSISFIVLFNDEKELENIWKKFSTGGKVLMDLQKYDWSPKYGWIEDRFGLSWQLMLTEDKVKDNFIPSLLFVDKVYGKAEEAINFYKSVFRNSNLESIYNYGPENKSEDENAVMYADFLLEGKKFAAMDSAREHNFNFNEAISLMVNCEDQKEIDYYWGKLSVVPQAEQCGWCKDKYGVSWQVNPIVLSEMLSKGSREQIDRVTKAFMPMKKFNVAELEKAYKG
jgi:predicted 3-demethylubiquinone-9 3-methyltransferase (glyoxalase superfamily)